MGFFISRFLGTSDMLICLKNLKEGLLQALFTKLTTKRHSFGQGDTELTPSNTEFREKKILLIVRGSCFKDIGLKSNRHGDFYPKREDRARDLQVQTLLRSTCNATPFGRVLSLSLCPTHPVLAGQEQSGDQGEKTPSVSTEAHSRPRLQMVWLTMFPLSDGAKVIRIH